MIKVKIMGGLGNQMFQYAALRAMMLQHNTDGEMVLDGLSNMGHAIYSLDHFNIAHDVKISDQKFNKIENFLFRIYEKNLASKKISYSFICKLGYILNLFGFYFIPDGYSKFHFSFRKNIDMIGYFQSDKYFKQYEDIIKNELMVKEPLLEQNKEIFQKINETDSVCVHIRRGDFVNSVHQICNIDYFKKAIQIMNSEIEKPIYYIFSDDIEWVKDNLKVDANLVYVDNNNPNYEDLRLMYSCKHFIMSNSSFSWWAQYLSKNNDKKIIAPNRWYNNDIRCDIYQDNWKII